MNLKPKTKLKALGCKKVSEIDPQILNSKSIKLYEDPHPHNIRKNHGAQFFQDFLDGLRDKPQQAQWQEGMYLALIEIQPITTEEYDINILKAAFEAFYLGVNVVLFPEKLTIIENKGKYYLENKQFNINFPILNFHNGQGEKINLSSNNIIKAQRQLLKNFFSQKELPPGCLLTSQNVFSSISFIDHPIVIECVPDNIITGRANGYQGAVIGMKGCVQREIITTALHECLHIFSIDHCIWWDCIMNFSYEFSHNSTEGGTFHLCPSCLKKVQYQLGFDILDRYKRMYDFFEICDYEEDMEFVQAIMKTF